MRYCDKCHVQIVGKRDVCPLCQGPVTTLDDDEREVFPFVPTIYHQYNLLFRALIFASVVVGVLAIVVNILVPSHFGWWSAFVLAGIGCFWMVLVVAVAQAGQRHEEYALPDRALGRDTPAVGHHHRLARLVAGLRRAHPILRLPDRYDHPDQSPPARRTLRTARLSLHQYPPELFAHHPPCARRPARPLAQHHLVSPPPLSPSPPSCSSWTAA